MLNSRSRIEIEMLLGIDWWNKYLIILPSANIISQTIEEQNILTIHQMWGKIGRSTCFVGKDIHVTRGYSIL